MSLDSDTSVLKAVLDYAWAIVGALVGVVWKSTNEKIDTVKTELTTEVNRQRDVSAKIFDKLEDMREDANEKHLELLRALHEGLARKQDK